MALQSSGAISFSQIRGEHGGSAPDTLDEYYRGGDHVADTTANASVPTSGAISVSDFYGTSADTSTPVVEPSVTAITLNELGRSAFGTQHYRASQGSSGSDDSSYLVNFPSGFTFNFLGTDYSGVYFGTNGYFTFGQGSSDYSVTSVNDPLLPGIKVFGADRRLYWLFSTVTGTAPNRKVIVRWEGTNYNPRLPSGALSISGNGSGHSHIYEVHFYENSAELDLRYVACQNRGQQYLQTGNNSDSTYGSSTVVSWTSSENTSSPYTVSSAYKIICATTGGSTSIGTVSVNNPVTSVEQGNSHSYTASVSGDDTNLSYAWSISGNVVPITNSTSQTCSIQFTSTGTFTVTVQVSSSTASDSPQSTSFSVTVSAASTPQHSSNQFTITNGGVTLTLSDGPANNQWSAGDYYLMKVSSNVDCRIYNHQDDLVISHGNAITNGNSFAISANFIYHIGVMARPDLPSSGTLTHYFRVFTTTTVYIPWNITCQSASGFSSSYSSLHKNINNSRSFSDDSSSYYTDRYTVFSSDTTIAPASGISKVQITHDGPTGSGINIYGFYSAGSTAAAADNKPYYLTANYPPLTSTTFNTGIYAFVSGYRYTMDLYTRHYDSTNDQSPNSQITISVAVGSSATNSSTRIIQQQQTYRYETT